MQYQVVKLLQVGVLGLGFGENDATEPGAKTPFAEAIGNACKETGTFTPLLFASNIFHLSRRARGHLPTYELDSEK